MSVYKSPYLPPPQYFLRSYSQDTTMCFGPRKGVGKIKRGGGGWWN